MGGHRGDATCVTLAPLALSVTRPACYLPVATRPPRVAWRVTAMMRRPLSAALLIGVVGLGATAAITLPAHAGSPTVHAGLTSIDAAPSCWAIKQSFPSSKDGIYWLATAALQAPQPFYCDMTTDGGGWVLVGRGRNGWKWREVGQGSAAL